MVPVRWSMVPVQRFEPFSTTEPGKADTNYLFDALVASIHRHPLQWHLVVTVGQPGDPTDDATLPWPPDRPRIEVGTLTIDHVESEDTSPARDYPIVMFGPVHLPPILPANPALCAALRPSHTILAYLLFATFLAHLSAVLSHTLIVRDRLLDRMALWPVRPRQDKSQR